MKIVGLFSGFDVKPYALVDSEDVDPGLVRRIKAAAEGYFAAGIDPFRDIQVSTVI